jgi:predicted nuclease of predicted toxin-antitoxin system
VKFLIDAQLPARLARRLNDAGHDAIHTLDLPDQNRTTDAEIARLADAEDRIVVSKDSDFRDSHLLSGTPARLLVVTTGNISNHDLFALIDEHLDELVAAFQRARLVHFTTDDLLILDED